MIRDQTAPRSEPPASDTPSSVTLLAPMLIQHLIADTRDYLASAIDDDDGDLSDLYGNTTLKPQPRPYAMPYQGVPKASEMSEAEIAADIARGVDPWSLDLHGHIGLPPTNLHIPALISAVELCALFPRVDDAGRLLDADGLSVFVITNPAQLGRVASGISGVISALRDCVPPPKTQKQSIACAVPMQNGTVSRDPMEQRRTFARKIDDALSAGHAMIALCDSVQAISDAGRAAMAPAMIWPQLTAEMILFLLKQTHSVTGQVAEDVIASILPSDEDLNRIATPLICHAFRASSTLAVAKRLAKYAESAKRTCPKLTLEDVKGLPEATAKLCAIVTDLRDRQCGKVTWTDVSASALLHGPPGTGKTMLVEAMAGSADAHFIATSFTDLQAAGHMGDYLKAMAAAVAEAIPNAPSVIYFDELDSYGARDAATSAKHDRYMTSIVNDLLQQLTRLNAAEGVIVLGATNFIDKIDAAILRSGRFDTKIAITNPDKAGVRAILSHHMQADFAISDDIINRLLGQTGADLANIARDAKARARRLRRVVTVQDLTAAIDATAMPATGDDLYRIAIHEAGHIVMAAALNLPLPVKATISPKGGNIIRDMSLIHTSDSVQYELACHMGGRAAEHVMLGKISSGSGGSTNSDLSLATDLATAQEHLWGLGESGLTFAPVDPAQRHALPEKRWQIINDRLHAAEDLARRTLRTHKNLLRSIAQTLIAERELNQSQIRLMLATMVVGQMGGDRANIEEHPVDM